MIDLIENGQLSTDLDAMLYDLKNVGLMLPVPTNVCAIDDPRLSDARIPLDGSVTDASIADGANIAQFKINFNGVIPPAWLGTAATQAAQGDLVEYLSNKNQPNGYAGLDGGGKVPSAQIPAAVGTGTITSIGLTMPGVFSVSGSPVTGAGTISVDWALVADKVWFGNDTGGPAAPQFNLAPLPVELIPTLDASQVISGLFDAARLPAAVGIGVGHVQGAVPDPGPGGGGALATDYLARDMTYKPIPDLLVPYEPTVDVPTFSPSPNPTGDKIVVINETIPDCVLMISLASAVTGFIELPDTGYITIGPSVTVWCYAAKAGYNNSPVVSYTNPNP